MVFNFQTKKAESIRPVLLKSSALGFALCFVLRWAVHTDFWQSGDSHKLRYWSNCQKRFEELARGQSKGQAVKASSQSTCPNVVGLNCWKGFEEDNRTSDALKLGSTWLGYLVFKTPGLSTSMCPRQPYGSHHSKSQAGPDLATVLVTCSRLQPMRIDRKLLVSASSSHRCQVFLRQGLAKIRENVAYEMDLVLSMAAQPFYATSSLHKLWFKGPVLFCWSTGYD